MHAERIRSSQIEETMRHLLTNEFMPACIASAMDGTILYTEGNVKKYLQLPHGYARLNLFEMAPENLKLKLQIEFKNIFASKQSTTLQKINMEVDHHIETINLILKYYDNLEEIKPVIFIIFEELKTEEKKKISKNRFPRSRGGNPEIKFLENELQSTKKTLGAMSEEYERQNQNLQSANKELLIINQELEKSQTELFSNNNSLMNLAEKDKEKIHGLNQITIGINDLLAKMKIVVIFLDGKLNIKYFSPEIKSFIHLLPSDIGRPLCDFALKLECDNLFSAIHSAIESKEIQKIYAYKNNTKYEVNIMPIENAENKINLISIVFFENQ